MRRLSFPTSSDSGTVGTSAPASSFDDPVAGEPWEDRDFRPDEFSDWTRHAAQDDLRPPPGRSPKSPPPKQQSSPRFPWFSLTLCLVFIAGLTLYWRLVKGAAVLALGWFFVAAIVAFSRVLYFVVKNILVRLFRRGARIARLVFLPQIIIFAAVSVWRVAPYLPVVDRQIDVAVERKLSEVAPHFVFHSADGAEVFSEGTRLVGADEVWKSNLKPAIVGIEDERFLERDVPIDPKSVARALYHNWTSDTTQGASTLQVQNSDLLFEDFHNKYGNKLFEWAIALRLDARMPDRAAQLALYCNVVPGSEPYQGVASLAADFFNVSDLRRLTPAQAATIAGSLRGKDYNPRNNVQKALDRRNTVLKKMRDRGDLSEEQFQVEVMSDLKIERKQKPYEYFVKAAWEENSAFLGQASKQVGMPPDAGTIQAINEGRNVSPVVRVNLTLDPALQQIAERKIADPISLMISRGRLPSDADVAFVLMENDSGRVLAVIPALNGEFDLSRRTARDPGSTWKPLQAAAALTRHAVSETETFPDLESMSFNGAVVHNFGNRYSGQHLSLVDCLARSSNVCAMQVQMRLRPEQWRVVIEELNLPAPGSFAKIGIGDNWHVPLIRLAAAYTALQNGGEMAMPNYVSSVILPDGRSVEAEAVRRRVFDPEACRVVLAGMKASLTRGTGTAAKGLSNVAWGKTGTTQDSMAVLQTRKLTMVVWIGNRTSNADLNITGGALAMKLLAALLAEVRKARPQLAPLN